jgi:hypothetical protein
VRDDMMRRELDVYDHIYVIYMVNVKNFAENFRTFSGRGVLRENAGFMSRLFGSYHMGDKTHLVE